MTVRGIVFKECAGPAVVATGTAGLVIDDCVVDNVAGTYAGGHYPFAAVNVTGFNLKGCAWKADEAIWDGQAYFDGGTAETLSEAYTNAVVVNVTANGWLFWNDATNRLGLTAAAYNGKTLRKIGTGTFDPQSIGVSNVNIAAVEILQGQYVARANAHLGKPKGPVHVCDGASLTLAGSTKNAHDRTITISGRGISRENPAVRFSSSVTWDKTDSVTWVLEGDATMYSATGGENGTFLWGTVHTHGHTLTLDGISSANYRFGRSVGWYEGGTVVVSNVLLSASSSGTEDHSSAYKLKDNIVPKFIFRNGARFVPDDDDIFTVVKDCEFETGTQIAPKYADVPVTFTNLTGAPTGTVNATTITVTGKYTARAAEVSAGRSDDPAVHLHAFHGSGRHHGQARDDGCDGGGGLERVQARREHALHRPDARHDPGGQVTRSDGRDGVPSPSAAQMAALHAGGPRSCAPAAQGDFSLQERAGMWYDTTMSKLSLEKGCAE